MKTIFREYTDDTFTKLKSRPPEWEHLGMLGPLLRAEVGDTIRVVFKNNGRHPFSLHPHGVFYTKDSEGAQYDDGTGSQKGAVPPGGTQTYVWPLTIAAPRRSDECVRSTECHAREDLARPDERAKSVARPNRLRRPARSCHASGAGLRVPVDCPGHTARV